MTTAGHHRVQRIEHRSWWRCERGGRFLSRRQPPAALVDDARPRAPTELSDPSQASRHEERVRAIGFPPPPVIRRSRSFHTATTRSYWSGGLARPRDTRTSARCCGTPRPSLPLHNANRRWRVRRAEFRPSLHPLLPSCPLRRPRPGRRNTRVACKVAAVRNATMRVHAAQYAHNMLTTSRIWSNRPSTRQALLRDTRMMLHGPVQSTRLESTAYALPCAIQGHSRCSRSRAFLHT
jgi:hypothetical protein